MRQALAAHMQSRTPNWTRAADEGGGGGGDTGAGGGGSDTVGGGGGQDDVPWFSTLPDDLKGQPGVTRHKTLTDFANSAIALEKRLGAGPENLLKVPTKPEELPDFAKEVYKRLGAPDAPEGYKLEWEGMTDDDKAMAGKFAKFMHEKGGFPPDAVAAAAEFWRGETEAAAKAEQDAAVAANTAALEALKGEYGAAFDDKMKAVSTFLKSEGGEALAAELDVDNKVGANPELFKLLVKITDRLAEPGPGNEKPKSGDGRMTPQEALAARTQLELDPVKMRALMDPSDPMHKAIVDERRRYLAYENGRDPT